MLNVICLANNLLQFITGTSLQDTLYLGFFQWTFFVLTLLTVYNLVLTFSIFAHCFQKILFSLWDHRDILLYFLLNILKICLSDMSLILQGWIWVYMAVYRERDGQLSQHHLLNSSSLLKDSISAAINWVSKYTDLFLDLLFYPINLFYTLCQ